MNIHNAVTKFHEVFGHNINEPNNCSIPLRLSLIGEEAGELIDALLREDNNTYSDELKALFSSLGEESSIPLDIVGIADALGDIVYVVFGMAIELGIDLNAVLEEIHRANMSKLGADGKPIYNEQGKVMKGPNYAPPDIASVLQRTAKK